MPNPLCFIRRIPAAVRLAPCLMWLFFSVCTPASAISFPQEADPVHLLILGLDTQETGGEASPQELVLCSFLPDSASLVLTTLPQELSLTLPGQSQRSLCQIFAEGGMEAARQALEEGFSICITGCIGVDLSGLPGLVETLEGVTLTLTREEADHISRSTADPLSSGTQQLSGEQALSYARIPDGEDTDADSRSLRRRKLTAALFDRCRSLPPTRWQALWNSLEPMLSTDMKKRAVFRLAMELLPMARELTVTTRSYCAPVSR